MKGRFEKKKEKSLLWEAGTSTVALKKTQSLQGNYDERIQIHTFVIHHSRREHRLCVFPYAK